MKSGLSVSAFLLFICASVSLAQQGPVPEKVYVHVDRTCYAAGETIWLAGYVENALPEVDTSRFLYAELLGPDGGGPIMRTKVKRGREGFAGHLDIPDTLSGGTYLLRAYTRWQLNWPEDRLFIVPLRIFGTGEMPAVPELQYGIDISFYPEGGRYFAGEAASVGFKVMNARGRSVELSGKIVDDLGTEVTTGQVLHAGMGLLSFTPAEGRRYSFVPDGGGKPWDLPVPDRQGATLQVRRVGAQWLVKVINRTGNPCHLRFCDAGSDVVIGEIPDTGRTFRVDGDSQAEGIRKFRLTDNSGNILSERAVFCGSSRTEAVALSVGHEGGSYTPRTRHRVRLRLPSGIEEGEVSVSVVRGAFGPYRQEEGIAGYMYLGSELRGHIEEPDYYFDPAVPEKDRRSALDLLLLIQGWTYYDYVPQPAFGRETTQSLQGEIRGISRRPPRNYLLSVIAPSLNYSQIERVTEGGHFVVDSLDFRDSTVFILQSAREGLLQKYSPLLLPGPVAVSIPPKTDRTFYDARLAGDGDGPSGQAVSPFPDGIFMLDTIRTLTVQADYVRIKSPFGNTPRMGAKTREDLDPYGHMTLIDYVLMQKPSFSRLDADGQVVVRDTRSYEYFGDIALCVNGIRLDWNIGETIHLSEVDKISISTRDSDSFLLHADGVVLVELRGPGQRPTVLPGNTAVVSPLGWQSPRDFYHPRYDHAGAWGVDQRNTVYWNPSLYVPGGAGISFSFYTEDKGDGPYFLHIEGRTSDGRWISTSESL